MPAAMDREIGGVGEKEWARVSSSLGRSFLFERIARWTVGLNPTATRQTLALGWAGGPKVNARLGSGRLAWLGSGRLARRGELSRPRASCSFLFLFFLFVCPDFWANFIYSFLYSNLNQRDNLS